RILDVGGISRTAAGARSVRGTSGPNRAGCWVTPRRGDPRTVPQRQTATAEDGSPPRRGQGYNGEVRAHQRPGDRPARQTPPGARPSRGRAARPTPPGRPQEGRGDAAPREMAAARGFGPGNRIRLTGRLLHFFIPGPLPLSP